MTKARAHRLLTAVAIRAITPVSSLRAEDLTKVNCVRQNAGERLHALAPELLFHRRENPDYIEPFVDTVAVADECARRFSIAENQQSDYFFMGLADAARAQLAIDLGKQSLQMELIDKALDLRAGGANPDTDTIFADDHVQIINRALKAVGVDVDSIDADTWQRIGEYAVATSFYWRTRDTLGM